MAAEDGATALHLAQGAAAARAPLLTSLLLDAKSAVDQIDGCRHTALHLACSHGSLASVQQLLAGGGSVHAADSEGRLPIHHGASSGQLQIVLALMGAKASINTVDDSGLTPLHVASMNDHAVVVRALVEAADPASTEQFVCKASLQFSGSTALHLAAEAGASRAAGTLLCLKANPNCVDSEVIRQRPLHLAALHGHSQTARLIIDAKGN